MRAGCQNFWPWKKVFLSFFLRGLCAVMMSGKLFWGWKERKGGRGRKGPNESGEEIYMKTRTRLDS